MHNITRFTFKCFENMQKHVTFLFNQRRFFALDDFFFDKTLFAKKVLITKYFFVYAILLELLGGWYFRTHVALTKMKEKYQILLIAHIKHV